MGKRIILMFMLLFILVVGDIYAIRVGIVVTFPNNYTFTQCVNVPENIDGYEIMQKTDLSLEWSYHNAFGHSLCRIFDTGCPASNCFCNDKYWNFYTAGIGDREWRYSSVGFDGGSSCNEHYCAKDGDLLGFAYGGFGTKPKFFEFRDVCRDNKIDNKNKGSESKIIGKIIKSEVNDTPVFISLILIGLLVVYFVYKYW